MSSNNIKSLCTFGSAVKFKADIDTTGLLPYSCLVSTLAMWQLVALVSCPTTTTLFWLRDGMDRYAAQGRNGGGAHYYGEGAPQGDPFHPTYAAPAPAPQYIGLGRPPASRDPNLRSTSLNTPVPATRPRPASRAVSFAGESSHPYDTGTTPTPANRYQRPLQQFPIPEESMKMDRLLDMMQALLNDNVEIKERLSYVESTISKPAASTAVRGLPAARGGRLMRSATAAMATLRTQQHVSGDSDDETVDPSLRRSASASTTDVSTDSELEPASVDEDSSADLADIDLSEKEQRALQDFLTKKFRLVCGVEGSRWPDPTVRRSNATTGQVYPTPFFDLRVSDHQNRAVLLAVAKEVNEELKDKDAWPSELRRPRTEPHPTWDVAFLVSLAKVSFRSFRRQWNDNKKRAAGIKAGVAGQIDRRLKRRKRKSKQLGKVIEEYAQRHGLNLEFLTDLINEQYLSDEVSGPDDSDETKEEWELRLAAAADLVLDRRARNPPGFLEVLIPEWRSDRYSDLIHHIEKFRFDTKGEDTTLHYNRVCVGRLSDRIPKFAPYNFGIARDWFERHRGQPEYRPILKTWGSYPEPQGCGLDPARPVPEVDPRFNFNFND
ncbi:hypothetical protein DFH06DRAFT_1245364 [Mycena polygramma]|nr:hypothetical protein DFH06DRAFT_1245364 [Mycena polygramma]